MEPPAGWMSLDMTLGFPDDRTRCMQSSDRRGNVLGGGDDFPAAAAGTQTLS